MELLFLTLKLIVFFLTTCPGIKPQNTKNIKDHTGKDERSGKRHNLTSNHLQDQNESHHEIEYSSTNRLGRYRYQGPGLPRKSQRFDVQKPIVDEFIDARFVDGLENNTDNKLADKLALPFKAGQQGWQMDNALINKHFQLVNGERFLEDCDQRQWTQWSSWSACSAQCGFASTFRYRDCIFLDRVAGKKDCGYFSFRDCKGKDVNRIQCLNLPPCIETTSWGEWGECSALCQGQIGVRKRVMFKESSRGTKQKMPQTTQVESCRGSRSDCAGWSQWSRCSVSCSNEVGIRERTLLVTTPENFHRRDDSRLQMEPCVGQRRLCEAWTSWSGWTSCECKSRRKRRERTCERRFVFKSASIGIKVENHLCSGHAQMSVPCTPVDGACEVRPLRSKYKIKRRRLFLSSLKVKPKGLRSRRRVPGCILGCHGMPVGRYPSCRSCFHYWQCYSRRRKERMCAKRRRWDDEAKKCLAWSSTCPGV